MYIMHEYVGNVHIHSTYSDGTGTVEEITRAAQKAHLDFIVITDHENLKGSLDNKEGWYNDNLVLFGVELNREDHHYLAFNITEELSVQGLSPQKVIDLVNQHGGFGFIAHPFEKGSPMILKGCKYPWNDWKVWGFRGIEIWNYSSQWRDYATNLFKALYMIYFHKASHKNRPCPQALKKWDEFLSQGHKVLALGGSDAHAVKIKKGPWKPVIFPYEDLFKAVNTHLLLKEGFSGEKDRDKHLVFQALNAGHYFIANDLVHPSQGFRFIAESQKEYALPGESINLCENTVLNIKIPSRRSIIRVIKDGEVVSQAQNKNLIFKVLRKGAFRVEIYYRTFLGRSRPWIYSNPIFVC